jgi:sphinganine-1-phosphate aldolase
VKYVKRKAFNFAKNFSFLNSKLDEELNKVKVSLNEEISHSNMGNLYIQRLPAKGKTNEEILDMIQSYVKMVVLPYEKGALSGCVYGASDTITELSSKVFGKYCWSNPMHADVFPDIRKMEAEVVRWVLNIYNGDQNTCGTVFLSLYLKRKNIPK